MEVMQRRTVIKAVEVVIVIAPIRALRVVQVLLRVRVVPARGKVA